MNRHAAERRGRGAESLACWYLRLKGWRILARRARVPGGEVDIVARRGRILAFVEVKARATKEAAAFSLDAWRLRRVAVAAERLAPRYMRGHILGPLAKAAPGAAGEQALLHVWDRWCHHKVCAVCPLGR